MPAKAVLSPFLYGQYDLFATICFHISILLGSIAEKFLLTISKMHFDNWCVCHWLIVTVTMVNDNVTPLKILQYPFFMKWFPDL